jgi:hypothetical protein
VIFCSHEGISFEDLREEFSAFLSDNLPPDEVIFVVRENKLKTIFDYLLQRAADSSDWRLHPSSVPMQLVAFDKLGALGGFEKLGELDVTSITEDVFADIKRQGLVEIFVRRDGLLRPSSFVHYVHPSGRHSQGFIRAANLLINGAEVMFIALCLLKELEKDPSHIWLDTSSIACIAYAMIALRQNMDGPYLPTINSFSSYEGVNKTRFERVDNSLVLISATTSGGLQRKLVRTGKIPSDRVINLFSLAQPAEDLRVLCDLSKEDRINPQGAYSAKTDYPDGDCPFCSEGSKPVRFVGDQFLAEAVKYDSYTIRVTDAPKDLSKIMRAYQGLRAFQLRAKSPTEVDANDIYIDLSNLISDNDFGKKFDHMVDRYVPLTTCLVVHGDSDSCEKLGKRIIARLGQVSKRLPEIVSVKDLSSKNLDELSGGVVIVSSCVGSGSLLQSISRDLRDAFKHRPRIYIIPFAKFSHTDKFKDLGSDLNYNGPGGLKHEFAILHNLVLPKLPNPSPWQRERDFLKEISDSIDQGEAKYPPSILDIVRSRIGALDKLVAGSSDGLFWETAKGEALRLRPSFAFWPQTDYDPSQVSHADVFVTIASVLESARNGPSARIRHSPFHQSLLAPACFGRYNDGIIQSSLLRAALPSELHYAADASLSRSMFGVISQVLEGWAAPKGEAAIEFLVALCTRRMSLVEGDIKNLHCPEDAPDILKGLLGHAQAFD